MFASAVHPRHVASCGSCPALPHGHQRLSVCSLLPAACPGPAPGQWDQRTCPQAALPTCNPRCTQQDCLQRARSRSRRTYCQALSQRAQAAWSVPLDDPWAALLLAWFASRGRSLLAAQCLVEAALQLHMSGTSFPQIQLGVKLASLRAGMQSQDAAAEPQDQAQDTAEASGVRSASLLSEQEEGELLSWVALVVLAAQVAGVMPAAQRAGQMEGPEGGLGQSGGSGDSERYLKGMRGFVNQAYNMWKGGMTLRRLTDLQAAVSQGQSAMGVQAVMQQYTRIAVMALEVMLAEQLVERPPPPPATGPGALEVDFMGRPAPSEAAGMDASPTATAALEQRRPEEGEEEEEAAAADQLLVPMGYTSTFVNGPVACRLPSASMEDVPGARPHAIRLLVAFMGAVMGAPYALDKFVESVFVAYSQGWTAAELVQDLDERDFAQTGGLVQAVSGGGTPAATGSDTGMSSDDYVSSNQSPGVAVINRQLFGVWISCGFMALARLGAPFPEASLRPGWAWAGQGSAADAMGLDSFLQNSLRRCMEDLAQQGQGGPESTPTPSTRTAPSPPPSAAQSPLDTSVSALMPALGEIVGPEAVAAEATVAAVTTMVRDPFLERLQQDDALAKQLEQEREAAARDFLSFGRLRGKLLPDVLVKVQDEGLADTSSALRLLSMQTELVRRVLALTLRLQGQEAA